MTTPTTSPSNSASGSSTHGDALRADPRIQQARELIAQALQSHASELSDVKEASTDLADDYQSMLDQFAKVRGGPMLWPYLSSGLGNGLYVELADGSVKLDFIGGIGVHGCGHSHPAMVDVAIDAALEDTIMQGNLQQHPPSLKMSQRLIGLAEKSGASLEHCVLSTSGAMANENALKLAMHYQSRNSTETADRIIAFDNAFAGRTLALASLTDRPKYRMGLPLAMQVDFLPFLDPDSPASSTQQAADELKRLLDRHPGRYAGFWAEMVAGEGGYYPGSQEFFQTLCRPLREAKVPILFDEIQTFGRTSEPFAFQHFGLDEFADIVTVGKITQVCATLYGKDFHPQGPILSQTFTGSSSSIAAGIKTLNLLEETNCFGETGMNQSRHEYFAKKLAALAEKYPDRIRGPFGVGMMIALTPGDGSFDHAKKMMETMYGIGLLGFVCGANPTRIRFLPPPAITTTDHIDSAIVLLEKTLHAMSITP